MALPLEAEGAATWIEDTKRTQFMGWVHVVPYSWFECVFHVYKQRGSDVLEYDSSRGRAVAVFMRWYLVIKILELQRQVCEEHKADSTESTCVEWLASFGSSMNDVAKYVDNELEHAEAIHIDYSDLQPVVQHLKRVHNIERLQEPRRSRRCAISLLHSVQLTNVHNMRGTMRDTLEKNSGFLLRQIWDMGGKETVRRRGYCFEFATGPFPSSDDEPLRGRTTPQSWRRCLYRMMWMT